MATRIRSRKVADTAAINITVAQQPEGVWLAYSDDLPGLIVETDTRDGAVELARELALDLMELRGSPATS